MSYKLIFININKCGPLNYSSFKLYVLEPHVHISSSPDNNDLSSMFVYTKQIIVTRRGRYALCSPFKHKQLFLCFFIPIYILHFPKDTKNISHILPPYWLSPKIVKLVLQLNTEIHKVLHFNFLIYVCRAEQKLFISMWLTIQCHNKSL